MAWLPAWASPARVTDVRLWSGPEGTRLVIELSAPVEYDVFALDDPDRVVVDLANTTLPADETLPPGQGPVKSLRSGPQQGQGLRFVLDVTEALKPRSFVVGPDGSAGHRLVVELPGKPVVVAAPMNAARTPPAGNEVLAMVADTSRAVAAPAVPKVTEPTPLPTKVASSAVKGRDLVIAIDAGHGGQDPGAIGRGGTREKDVTLAIARKLAAEINAEDGMKAVLIREGDYFITLGGRTRKARQLGADMFVSIHADSVQNRAVSGSSVYVLSLRGASDEAAKWLADSENAADLKGGVSLDDSSDVLASVLLDVTQKESISDSVEAADSVLTALRGVGNAHRHAACPARGLHRAEVAGHSFDAGRDGFHFERDGRAAPARSRSPVAHCRGGAHGRAQLLVRQPAARLETRSHRGGTARRHGGRRHGRRRTLIPAALLCSRTRREPP